MNDRKGRVKGVQAKRLDIHASRATWARFKIGVGGLVPNHHLSQATEFNFIVILCQVLQSPQQTSFIMDTLL